MDKYVFVEHASSLNAVLAETFKSTQRIKLTSFDVSKKYLIFGASSGGIYVFKRSPCEFLKLIPSREGSILQLKVSRDEKSLALASSRGLVVVLQNFFVDLNLRPLVHNEHDGCAVSAMDWYGSDLYCGDVIGRVSIFTSTSLLTKVIFQAPSAVLMQLDSTVIQIDTYSKFLLISTKTRTYLCDTEKEQYKQIGKKLRDGNYGACFCEISNCESASTFQPSKGAFKTVQEDEEFSSPLNNNGTKIFCARPRARLWEADFDASVLVTYQFKESLGRKVFEMLQIDDSPDAKLNISTCTDTDEFTSNFSFGKIYPICRRLIFTYQRDGIYFFDPVTSSVIFWTSSFKNIIDVKVSDNFIFLWRGNFQMNLISVQLLEELMISRLLNKQYYLCAELSVHFLEDLLNLIQMESNKVSLLLVLKEKLKGADELLNGMDPIFAALDNHYKQQTLVKRLENGIVVIDNGYVSVEEPSESVQEIDENENDNALSSLYTQYLLNKSHKSAELTECSNVFRRLNLDESLLLLEEFVRYVEGKDGGDAVNWCREQLIKSAARSPDAVREVQPGTARFLSESFLKIYTSTDLSCKCKFPLPKAHLKKLENYKLATELLDQSDNKSDYLNNVPYLYNHHLRKADADKTDLHLLTQFSDKALFAEFIYTFTYDSWDEILRLFLRLRQGCCLNCDERIDTEGIWTWTTLGLLLIESIGARNATRLLTRYSQHIPSAELTSIFYKSCILAVSCGEPKLAVKFVENIHMEENSHKFEEMMGKFLREKYLGKELDITYSENFVIQKCAICQLPVCGSVLDEFKQCKCGIYVHNLCFIENNRICNKCIITRQK